MKRVICIVIMVTASCWFVAGSTWGAVFCVSNATELQNALNTATSNGENDTIRVVQGTYTSTGIFNYVSSEEHSITLEGGYTAGCASREVNPSLTILDDNNSNSGSVLYFCTGGGSDIKLEGFTIKNGNFFWWGRGRNPN